jgi:hypothetical protein
MPGRSGRTQSQLTRLKKSFLEHFAEFGNVSAAARHAGIERKSVYNWQEHDDEFAIAYQQAEIASLELMEGEARRRAVEGVGSQRRVYDNRGNLVDEYTETKYSDVLLIFLLKARAPEKYRDRHDITTGGQPLAQLDADIDAAIDRQLARLAARGQSALPVAPDGAPESTDA